VEALFAPLELRFVAATHPALHPGRCAQIFVGTQQVGWLGELHPQWQQQYDLPLAPLWFEIELDALLQSKVPRMQEIAKFLPVRRDLAVLVDDGIAVQSLLDAMKRCSICIVARVWKRAKKALHSACYYKILRRLSPIRKLKPASPFWWMHYINKAHNCAPKRTR
jgi:phenylalanyl-tRNA synthetase beta subunit